MTDCSFKTVQFSRFSHFILFFFPHDLKKMLFIWESQSVYSVDFSMREQDPLDLIYSFTLLSLHIFSLTLSLSLSLSHSHTTLPSSLSPAHCRHLSDALMWSLTSWNTKTPELLLISGLSPLHHWHVRHWKKSCHTPERKRSVLAWPGLVLQVSMTLSVRRLYVLWTKIIMFSANDSFVRRLSPKVHGRMLMLILFYFEWCIFIFCWTGH